MIEYRTPTLEDFDDILARDEQAFGSEFNEVQRDALRTDLPLERFRLATDGTDVVGVAGSWPFELTLPGSTQVPMGGTTWVSVAPSHRRRGILRSLMRQVHDDIVARGEPIAGLQASEASIYERFGYGTATRWRVVEIDRRRVELPPDVRAAAEPVRVVDPLEHLDRLTELWDRWRRSRVGEISRDARWIEARLRGSKAKQRCALHDDGYAVWSVEPDWHDFDAKHVLALEDLVACTPEAHTALWNLVLSHDLVGPIRSSVAVSLDDRLPQLLSNPRLVKTTTMYDFLWLCPFDVVSLAAARRYRIRDTLVVDVDGERCRIEGGPNEADASPTDDEPDLTMTRGAFGSLLMGGVSATELASGGRLSGSDLGRADAFFGWSPGPHCTTMF